LTDRHYFQIKVPFSSANKVHVDVFQPLDPDVDVPTTAAQKQAHMSRSDSGMISINNVL